MKQKKPFAGTPSDKKIKSKSPIEDAFKRYQAIMYPAGLAPDQYPHIYNTWYGAFTGFAMMMEEAYTESPEAWEDLYRRIRAEIDQHGENMDRLAKEHRTEILTLGKPTEDVH